MIKVESSNAAVAIQNGPYEYKYSFKTAADMLFEEKDAMARGEPKNFNKKYGKNY